MITFNYESSTPLPFSFQPTLDGTVYSAVISWNVSAQRPYITLSTLDGNVIFCLPLISGESAVNLVSLAWANGMVTATIDTSPNASPRRYVVGTVIDLTIAGAAPDAYNGQVVAQVLTTSSFQYPLAANPGPATSYGTVNYDISMTGGYFDSTLIYRRGSQQIEVDP